MSAVFEISASIKNYQDLAGAVIAQTCEDYFADGRALLRGNFRPDDDAQDSGDKRLYKKTIEAKMEDYRDWFLNPSSEFNTFYKSITSAGQTEESVLDGKMFVKQLDMMIEDIDAYPEDHHSFKTEY